MQGFDRFVTGRIVDKRDLFNACQVVFQENWSSGEYFFDSVDYYILNNGIQCVLAEKGEYTILIDYKTPLEASNEFFTLVLDSETDNANKTKAELTADLESTIMTYIEIAALEKLDCKFTIEKLKKAVYESIKQ